MSSCQILNINPGISDVMRKTVSKACNLACDYCYYNTIQGSPVKIDRKDDKILETFIQEYMEMK